MRAGVHDHEVFSARPPRLVRTLRTSSTPARVPRSRESPLRGKRGPGPALDIASTRSGRFHRHHHRHLFHERPGIDRAFCILRRCRASFRGRAASCTQAGSAGLGAGGSGKRGRRSREQGSPSAGGPEAARQRLIRRGLRAQAQVPDEGFVGALRPDAERGPQRLGHAGATGTAAREIRVASRRNKPGRGNRQPGSPPRG